MYISAAEKAIIRKAGLAITDDLEAFAEISGLHEAAVDGLTEAARNITRIEEDLRAKMEAAERDLNAARAALDAGQPINSYGILQTTGAMIDILAARRHDAYARLTAACRTAAALPVPATDRS